MITVCWALVLSLWAVTEEHRLGSSNNRNAFHTILEAEKFKIKTPADPMSAEGMLPGLPMAISSLCPPMVESRERASKRANVSCLRALIPFMQAPPSPPTHLPKAHILIPEHGLFRVSTYTF